LIAGGTTHLQYNRHKKKDDRRKQWIKCITLHIYKKESKDNSKNYLTINLQNSDENIYENYIRTGCNNISEGFGTYFAEITP